MRTSIATAFALCTTSCLASSESAWKRDSSTNQARADSVKEAFQFSWEGYYAHAFPHDELHPVSNGFGDSRNGWGASAVDALTTALVMNLPEVVDVILAHIATVDFTETPTSVSMFETTIRYLGGMLAGYDLLNGPLSDMQINVCGNMCTHSLAQIAKFEQRTNVPILVTQAKSLADTLSFAFDTPTGIPYNDLWFTNKTFADSSADNGLATIGTLVLEWTRLSDLTNDTKYTNLTQKAESYLLDPHPSSGQPWPGLVGSDVNITTGRFLDASGGWSGGDDSFYEYLLKMFVYDQNRFGTYRDRWVLAANSTMEHLTQHPSTRPDLTFVAEYNGQSLSPTSGHLTCFDGGNFILGGLVLERQDLIDYGLALTNGCHDTYNSTATHIGPERFSWNASAVPANQTEFFDSAGFFITTSYYDLRPEVIESYYYSYRATGDTKYQDWAWDAFVAINTTCRVGSGFAAILDVNNATGGGFIDNQESFWFAEVMKYSYLIHADDADWQVSSDGKNKFVFNTEAHPLQVVSADSTSSSSSSAASAQASPSGQSSASPSRKGNAGSRLDNSFDLALVSVAASILLYFCE